MTTRKHTPGQWVADGLEVRAEDDGWVLAEIIDTNDEGAANARLIAAAPEMLAACEAMLRSFERSVNGMYPDERAACLLARAAIAKATGEEGHEAYGPLGALLAYELEAEAEAAAEAAATVAITQADDEAGIGSQRETP